LSITTSIDLDYIVGGCFCFNQASHESLQALRRAAAAGTRAITAARLPLREDEAARALLKHYLSPPATAQLGAPERSSSSSSVDAAGNRTQHEPALDCVKLLVRLFLDFRAKQSFKQLQSLQATKHALPISSWEGRVLDAVAENQVVSKCLRLRAERLQMVETWR